MADLLFEIGCEEIPAGVVASVLPELERLAGEELRTANVKHGGSRCWAGPGAWPWWCGTCSSGSPTSTRRWWGRWPAPATRPGPGSPARWGSRPSRWRWRASASWPAGKVVGRAALELLPDMLTRLMGRLPFPKSMRWGRHSEKFVRPVRWLLAVFAGEVIPLEYAGVRSGRQSRGPPLPGAGGLRGRRPRLLARGPGQALGGGRPGRAPQGGRRRAGPHGPRDRPRHPARRGPGGRGDQPCRAAGGGLRHLRSGVPRAARGGGGQRHAPAPALLRRAQARR